MPLHWKCSILTPGPPGKSHKDLVLNSSAATFRLHDPEQATISFSLSFLIYAMELLIPTCRVSWKLYEGWRWKPGRGRCSMHTSIFNLFLLINSTCFFFSFLFPFLFPFPASLCEPYADHLRGLLLQTWEIDKKAWQTFYFSEAWVRAYI